MALKIKSRISHYNGGSIEISNRNGRYYMFSRA